MQRGKEPASLHVLGIERQEFLERGGRPAVLAGVHVGDGCFEESALLAVPYDALLSPFGGRFLVGFVGYAFVGPHVSTLADDDLHAVVQLLARASARSRDSNTLVRSVEPDWLVQS